MVSAANPFLAKRGNYEELSVIDNG
jgi:hypothetical protein